MPVLQRLELRANGHLNVGLRGAKIRKVPHSTVKSSPSGGVGQVVSRIGRGKIRVFPGQIVPVQSETDLRALADYPPALGGEKLHPIDSRSLQYAGAQSADGVRRRIREDVHVEKWVLSAR